MPRQWMTVEVDLIVEAVEPDGSLCGHCDKTINLTAYRISIYTKHFDLISQLPRLLCEDCLDDLKSETE